MLPTHKQIEVNRWKVGDILEGNEYGEVARIQLKYIGEDVLIAKAITRNGQPVDERECSWTLTCREWKKVN